CLACRGTALPPAVPGDPVFVRLGLYPTLFEQIVQVCDRLTGRHDQVVVVDLAREQGVERIDRAYRAATEPLESLEPRTMPGDQLVEALVRAAERLAVRRQDEHVLRHLALQPVERLEPLRERVGGG